MSSLFILGATGSLGSHVLPLALKAGHKVSVLVRNPSKLSPAVATRVMVQQGDLGVLAAADLASLINGHDALINCAGHVGEGQAFVDVVDRVVTAVDSLPAAVRPVSWFLAGAALLDIDRSGRRGVDLAAINSTYWPHQFNFERIRRSGLNWRVLCPGPMVAEPALGLHTLRISTDTLPVEVPENAAALSDAQLLPNFAFWLPQMIIPYADAAALMLSHLDRDDPFACHRVGIGLPPGVRGMKPAWTTGARDGS